jgi:3-methyladenine DNA glycosylase/8-oxoguanine DNA glycosylase
VLGLDHGVPAPLTRSFALPRPPNLAQTIAFARMGPGDPCIRVIDGSVWRATRTPLGPATERLSSASDRVCVEAWGPGAGWLLDQAPALCGALDSPESFEPRDRLLRVLAQAHPGLRIGRTSAVFETAMLATLEQRVATRDAWASWGHMIRVLGEPAPGPSPVHGRVPRLYVPPAPEQLARTPYEVFHRFGIERRRGEIIRRLAVVARRLEETCALPIETAHARLRSIIGIGAWTAARTAMIALGDADAVPLGDLHIPHLVAWRLAGERSGSDERMLELLAPYMGHRARVIRLLMQGTR